MGKITCYDCKKEKSVKVCGRCREVTKNQLAKIVLGLVRIHLSEDNRGNGRKNILNATDRGDLASAHRRGESFRNLSKRYGVSPATAHRIYHKEYDNWSRG